MPAALNITKEYPLHFEVEYFCVDETFEIEGNSTIKCLYSGQWSEPPRCIKQPEQSVSPLYVVLPMLLAPFVVYVSLIIFYKWTKKSTVLSLSRNRTYDAFLCYDFEGDNKYVLDTILPELEESCDPPFKICIHSRDFAPGIHIKNNIKEAIENSNSAIIVMSQSFVNSIWCKEEFADCYVENMRDPAYKLFVIMMQPVDNLQNTSVYMKSFFNTKTYLEVKDPKLFEKIANYLTWIKERKYMRRRRYLTKTRPK